MVDHDTFDFDADLRTDREISDYRPLCALAVVAFGLAVVSQLAWVVIAMSFLPLIAILVAIIALRRIASSDPPMAGRSLAVASLFLAFLSLAGTATQWYTYRMTIQREAQVYARAWFNLQRNHDITGAASMVQLVKGEMMGPPPATEAEKQQIAGGIVNAYRSRPEVQAILALGDQAEVRYYDTENQVDTGYESTLRQVYAVTFDQEGNRTTFFIRLTLTRTVQEGKSEAHWQITDIEGGIKPIALGGSA